MAARKKTGKSKTKTPAVRYLRYELTNSGTIGNETSHFIDLARDLSAVNRRLYRQGRDYHIRKITVVSSNTTNVHDPVVNAGDHGGRITVSTVPDSWTARGAWRRGFELWRKQRKDAVGMTNVKSGTYDDYKVHLSDDGRQATKLVPKDNGGNDLQLGEWNYASMVTPDGTTSADLFSVHWLGMHVGGPGSLTSVGLIQSYGDSRTTVDTTEPNIPSTMSDDPLMNIFDDGTVHDEVLEQIDIENDTPPYVVAQYPGSGGNMAKPLVVQDVVLSDGRAVMGSFSALGGLLELEAKSPIPNDVYSVLVELAPGNYRGIAAEVI